MRVAWVPRVADILFGGQALSFGNGDCGVAGFALAAIAGGGGTGGSASGRGHAGQLWGAGRSEHARICGDWMVRSHCLANFQTRWRAKSFAALGMSTRSHDSLLLSRRRVRVEDDCAARLPVARRALLCAGNPEQKVLHPPHKICGSASPDDMGGGYSGKPTVGL